MPLERVLDHLTSLYAVSDDPWNHRGSAYEATKYDATLAAIGPGPFHEALEIGCGNGTLARCLAPRCRRLTLMDCIPRAVEAARCTVADLPHLQVIEGTAPQDLPALRPDLVLLSEVLYFLTPEEISEVAVWLRRSATARVITVNWTGPTEEALDGTAAVRLLVEGLGRPRTRYYDGFRIDCFDVPFR